MIATVKLMYCPDCGIHTNHKALSNGNAVCWCGKEIPMHEPNQNEQPDDRPEWSAEDILEREG